MSAAPQSPYVGLVPFSVHDADYFFGRDHETELVIATLASRRLTLLFGPSGVGKSSVLRAGVLHRLRARAAKRIATLGLDSEAVRQVVAGAAAPGDPWAPAYAAADHAGSTKGGAAEPGTGRSAVVLDADEERMLPALPPVPILLSDWRDDPVCTLAERIREGVQEVYGPCALPARAEGANLSTMLRAWTAQLRADLYLILDQFDDFFLYHATEGPGRFGDQLAEVVRDPTLRVRVLLSFREENLAQLDRFKGKIPNLFANYLRLEYMGGDAARCAVVGPVLRHNQRADDRDRVALEGSPGKQSCLKNVAEPETMVPPPEGTSALVDEVLRQVRTSHSLGEGGLPADPHPGVTAPVRGDRVETPYLQLVMARVWEVETERWEKAGRPARRTLRAATLAELGGAERIVSEHLAAVLGDDRARLDAAAAIFGRLVTSEGRKIALTAAELSGDVDPGWGGVQELVGHLHDRSVLRNAGPPPGVAETPETQRWEIAHDVLAKAALRWRGEYLRAAALRRAEKRAIMRAVRWSLWIGGMLAAMAAGVLLMRRQANRAAEDQRNVAEEAQRQGLSNTLAALARLHLPTNPGLAATFAAAADSISPGTESLAVLQQALFEPVEVPASGFSTGRVPVVALRPMRAGRYFVATLGGELILRDSAGPDAPRDTVTGPVDAALLLGDTAAVVASGRPASHLRLVPLRGGGPRRAFSGHTERVYEMALHTDGKSLLSVDHDGKVLLHPYPGAPPRLVGNQNEAAVSVASGRGGAVAAGGEGGMLRVWNAAGDAFYPHRGHTQWVTALAFDPAGARLVSASRDSTARLWSVGTSAAGRPTLARLHVLRGHTAAVSSAEFSRDGRRVLTASRDGTARVWDAESGHLLAVLRHPSGVRVARFLQGDRIATGADDGRVRVWVWRDRAPALVAERSVPDSARVLARAGGTVVALPRGSSDPVVRWNGASEVSLERGGRRTVPRQIIGAAVSADGNTVATVENDSSAYVWNARTGALRFVFHPGEDPPVGAAFTPDSLVVFATAEGKAVVWTADGRWVAQTSSAESPSLVVQRSRLSWIIVPLPGKALVYACDVCIPRTDLIARYGAYLRPLSAEERKRYLGEPHPVTPGVESPHPVTPAR